jgi:histidyl-tRNA synthetase
MDCARAVFETSGYGEIHTPVFEFTEVFARTLGDSSDIVSKEMYSFEDRGGEGLTLRPEFTAGIARALMSNGMFQHLPLRLYAMGPLFRYERPQKGRMRQFHQIDAECFGPSIPLADVEVIAMGHRLLTALGLGDAVTLEINSLGDAASRQTYRTALVAYLKDHAAQLSDDSQSRLARNPLRILDSKDSGDRKLLENAPRIEEYFTTEANEFFAAVQEGLTGLNIAFTHNSRLVRGMDYYCHTVFEFVTDRLGAQGTVLAGGRYDGLMEQMGGPATPATGWAAGLERLEALLEWQVPALRPLVILPLAEEDVIPALRLAHQLRQEGLLVLLETQGNIKKRFARADKAQAWGVLMMGGEEGARGAAGLRLLDASQQIELPTAELREKLISHAPQAGRYGASQ